MVAIAEDVVVLHDTKDLDPLGRGEPAAAGEVGWVVGWQGLDKAVVKFHDGHICSVLLTNLRPVHYRPKGKGR